MKHAREDYNRIQDPEGLIPEDEPVFLLRGQDKFAPRLVERWAAQMDLHGGDRAMALAAIKHADEMRKWQEKNGSKIPDAPKFDKPSFPFDSPSLDKY